MGSIVSPCRARGAVFKLSPSAQELALVWRTNELRDANSTNERESHGKTIYIRLAKCHFSAGVGHSDGVTRLAQQSRRLRTAATHDRPTESLETCAGHLFDCAAFS